MIIQQNIKLGVLAKASLSLPASLPASLRPMAALSSSWLILFPPLTLLSSSPPPAAASPQLHARRRSSLGCSCSFTCSPAGGGGGGGGVVGEGLERGVQFDGGIGVHGRRRSGVRARAGRRDRDWESDRDRDRDRDRERDRVRDRDRDRDKDRLRDMEQEEEAVEDDPWGAFLAYLGLRQPPRGANNNPQEREREREREMGWGTHVDPVDGVAEYDDPYAAAEEQRRFSADHMDHEDENDWEDWIDRSYFTRGRSRAGLWDEEQSELSDWLDGVPLRRRTYRRPTPLEELRRIVEDDPEDPNEYEPLIDRAVRFFSRESVKFMMVVVLVPFVSGWTAHAYLFEPLTTKLDEMAPRAFALRDNQKVRFAGMVKQEEFRLKFEAMVGKTPPLSDEELLSYMRETALELAHHGRESNREGFSNLMSDAVAFCAFLGVLVQNQRKVQLLARSIGIWASRLSDTAKAICIILFSDILLGYHSDAGWKAMLDGIIERYGAEADQQAITIFIAIVPVFLDSSFKYWVFMYLNKISPSTTVTFRSMNRH
eukprot:jgi/Chlat1/629/Chrsp103S01044